MSEILEVGRDPRENGSVTNQDELERYKSRTA